MKELITFSHTKKIEALVKLLDDPDESIYTEVKYQLLLLGPVALPYLESAWDSAMNNLFLQRTEEIIEEIKFNFLIQELKAWKENKQDDLLYAIWLITSFQYPEISYEFLNKQLELIKKDIWLELTEDLTSIEEVRIINHILYEVHQFNGNLANYFAVQNNYLHYVLENKKGNTVSLGILYLLIAQKLKLPIFGVSIPDYLILSYINGDANLYDASFQSLDDAILFYINPFSKGILLQKEDISGFLEQIQTPSRESFFAPCSNIEIVQKLLNSIAESHEQNGNKEIADKYRNIIKGI